MDLPFSFALTRSEWGSLECVGRIGSSDEGLPRSRRSLSQEDLMGVSSISRVVGLYHIVAI
jgi:hypothetical protein